ncbi:MAG: hypothetical protein M3552_03860 [Planctomycetota bacterium]|nr:hypothetical protein [Planctomycetaceae bacterium]MDQ3329777.1 hypothetical protein [Planctomycetota bacterium]
MDEVQNEQQDVIEAQQDVREEEAELNEAQQEARDEGAGPALTDHTITTPSVPPVSESLPAEDADISDEPTLAPLEGGTDADATSEEVPNEGDPDAGTAAASDADSAEPIGNESGSADEETTAEEPEPAVPQ